MSLAGVRGYVASRQREEHRPMRKQGQMKKKQRLVRYQSADRPDLRRQE